MTAAAPAEASIIVEGLTKAFYAPRDDSETIALKDLSFSIRKGEFVCIVGPSGCGKTTALRVIADLEKPLSGAVPDEKRCRQRSRENGSATPFGPALEKSHPEKGTAPGLGSGAVSCRPRSRNRSGRSAA